MIKKLFPYKVKKLLKNFKVLAIDLGQWQSIKKEIPIDKENNPIPWYTYPAIEYLKQLDFTNKTIFEWGSGYSSLFWAKRAKEVVSVESDKKWFNIINKNKFNNLKIIFCEKKDDYIKAIINQNKKFDVIVIDGEYRYECAKNAIKCLADGGMIILDNSDWFPKTIEILRSYGLIQIDFNGFGPINNYTWTTSIFLSKNFNFKINQPQPIGGLKQHAEE